MIRSARILPSIVLGLIVLGPPGLSARAADAPAWKLDGSKSRLGFSGAQTGKSFDGKFTRYQATISLDPDHPEQGQIAVDVDLASAVTGDPQRDTALPGKDWFNIAEFPRARFASTSIRKLTGNSYEAAGNLTLRGVTQPFTLPFTLDVEGSTAHAKAHAALIRTNYGVGQGPWASGQWVALDVAVDIDVVATKGQ